jgi:signal transduction histidine kinase
MMLHPWLTDTIARRFALTVVFVALITLTLIYLFALLAGPLAQQPLAESGLLPEAADLVATIEAAPPQLRPSLTSAITSSAHRVHWLAAGSDGARALEATQNDDPEGTARRTVAALTHRRVLVLDPTSDPAWPAALRLDGGSTPSYLLGVQLRDRSWVVFTLARRSWGIREPYRWLIGFFFLAVASALVTVIAARRFAAPIKQLAVAVREFGVNPSAPPIGESGPSELRQVIRTFNEMQTQIQRFVAQRTMMLAAISHDLRTPLTRMRLRGELIEDPAQRHKLFRDVDEMQQMVDGALEFFRDDAAAEPSTAFDLPQVLSTIANDCADQKIAIRYRGPAHSVYYGRPFALKRAFNNLVQNAIKYATPPDIELSREHHAIIVSIRDRGPGIPDELLKTVFNPYYRVEKSRNRTTGGVGLGLTVALAVVQAHGGEIQLRNIAEGGLEARVILPLAF